MRHRKAGRKFGRNSTHRRAMFKNLAANLIAHERIETTEAKAKELRRVAERLVTRAARLEDDLTVDVTKLKDEERDRVLARRVHAQREVARFLPKTIEITKGDGTTEEIDIVYKLFHEIAPRYMARIKKDKGGGYTRVIKMLPRKGDNAKMALIEFIDEAAEA
jgi:large subunit ribosomal protein L17